MPETGNRLVLLFACFGHAWFHILVALFLTLVLILEVDWQLPYDDLIGLWTGGALLLGLAAPAAGWMGDRWGEARLMVVYLVGIGIATVLCGLSSSPTMLAVSLGLMGLFGAIYHPVGTAWVVKHATKRGKAIALLGICGSLGAAAASLVAALLAEVFDWRMAFILPGVFAIGVGLLLALCLATGLVAERQTDIQPQAEPSRGDVRRAFVVLVVTMSLTTIAYYAVTTMLPKWFEREIGAGLGDDLVGLGALIGLVYLIASTAQIAGGYFSDRGAAKRVYVISYALKLAALMAAISLTGWPVVLAAIVLLFVFDIAAPVENVLIARFTSSRRRGLAYGLRNGLTIAAGPIGVQMVALFFDAQTGFYALFLALAGLVAVIFFAALFLPPDSARADKVAVAS